MSMQVITGARVWRETGVFEERSIWIRDGRVVELTPPAPLSHADALRIVSWPGRYVLPGFVDAHTHLMSVAQKGLRCDLSGARGAAEVVARLAAHAAAHPGDAVVGVDFDEGEWSDPAPPTRAMLDEVDAARPVYARRVCCHAGVANDALLRRLTTGSRFVDAGSGRIVEDAVFEANRLTRPPADEVVTAVDRAIARLHALGITSIHDIVDVDGIETYGRGLRAARRPLGVAALLHTPARDFAACAARLQEHSAGRATAIGVKHFADGSLGARTAALNEAYADADTTGELLITRGDLAAELAACDAQEIVCAVHAIGDRALATVLDAVADAGPAGARCRIEHAEVVGPAELERCRTLRVPLVMQPNFVRNWGGEGGMYAARLGPRRWERHNPFATLLAAGVPVVFSSDAMPPGPLYGIKGATRHAVERERIGAAEALRRYTGGGFPGGPAGGVFAGSRADLVVLSGNPVLADLDSVRVESTWVGGVEVHESRAQSPTNHSKRRR